MCVCVSPPSFAGKNDNQELMTERSVPVASLLRPRMRSSSARARVSLISLWSFASPLLLCLGEKNLLEKKRPMWSLSWTPPLASCRSPGLLDLLFRPVDNCPQGLEAVFFFFL